MKRLRIACTLLLSGLLGSVATAHDFWVYAPVLRTAVDQPLLLDLRVGHPLEFESVVRSHKLLSRFVVTDSLGEREIVGREGSAPAGYTRSRVSGPMVVAYAGKPQLLEMEPAKFEAYLAEEGLDAILAWRKKHGESADPGRELYARCAKTLIEIDSQPEEERTKVQQAAHRKLRTLDCGLDLELFPVLATVEREATDEPKSGFKLLHAGKAIEGVLVRALHLLRPNVGYEARTDEKGCVEFKLEERGPWLIKAVHMVRSADEEDRADWKSYWASLLLEVPATESSAPPSK